MAEVPAQKGNTDLLELELGLAVREDDFQEANKTLDKFRDKLQSLESAGKIGGALKIPELDAFIKGIELFVAGVNKLNQWGLDFSLEHLGGVEYGLTPAQFANIRAMDKNKVLSKMGLSSEDVFSILGETQRIISATRNTGKLPSDDRFVYLYQLGKEAGISEFTDAKGLSRYASDPSADPLEFMLKIAGGVQKLLQDSLDPKLSKKEQGAKQKLASDIGKMFLTPAMMTLLNTQAIAYNEAGLKNANALSSLIYAYDYQFSPTAKSSKVLFYNEKAEENRSQIRENIGQLGIGLAVGAAYITELATEVGKTLTDKVNPINSSLEEKTMNARFFPDYAPSDYYGLGHHEEFQGQTSKETKDMIDRIRADMGYGPSFKFAGSKEYEELGPEVIFNARAPLALEYFYDYKIDPETELTTDELNTENDWVGEKLLMDAFYAAKKNDSRWARSAFAMRVNATMEAMKAGYTEDEALELLRGAEGSEVFDRLHEAKKKGSSEPIISDERYMFAINQALSSLQMSSKLKKLLELPSSTPDYGLGMNSQRIQLTAEPVEVPILVVGKDDKGNSVATVEATMKVGGEWTQIDNN